MAPESTVDGERWESMPRKRDSEYGDAADVDTDVDGTSPMGVLGDCHRRWLHDRSSEFP